ncbi:major facilitator superfamily protein [Pelomyxa schiedti]|nr:major facilitator superfamily protein [Pelomyxa schiedti]
MDQTPQKGMPVPVPDKNDDGKNATKSEESNKVKWYLIAGMLAWAAACSAVNQGGSMIALPADVADLAPDKASVVTGIISACGSAMQILGLLIVYLSDGCTFRYGRRRLFISFAALMLTVGCVVWTVGSAVKALWLVGVGYVIAFFGVACGNSLIPTLFTDLLPQTQHGIANGIMGLYNLIGSALGFGLFGLGISTWICLLVFAALSIVLLIPTILFAREKAFVRPPKPAEEGNIESGTSCASKRIKSIKSVITPFMFSPLRHIDFTLLLAIRVLYYVSTGAATYMQYWVGDTLQISNAEAVVGQMGMVTLFTAIIVAIPTGMLSDRLSRKPFVVAGLGILAVAVGLWAFVQNLAGVWVAVAVYGLGGGLYPCVETALACDCLPSNRDSGKFLGEFALMATFGQLIGQFGVGSVLQLWAIPHSSSSSVFTSSSNSTSLSEGFKQMYEHIGYTVVFASCAGLVAIGFLLALVIVPSRGKKAQQANDAKKLLLQ